ncbi:MAG: glycosyltransferase [Solirubrobacteraceae bacterium]
MTSANVDVVIPTFNAREMVLRCVERLVAQPNVAHVVVVDDASTDGTVEALTKRFPSVRSVRLKDKRGLAHAFNAGAAAGTAEFVLFLNDDIFAAPDAVGRLVESLREDAGAPSAAGRLVDPGTANTQVAYQPRELPGLAGLLARITGIERAWPRNPWTGQHLTAPLSEVATQRTRRQPAGACILVRRSALSSIGGWDERYWMWYEDVDFSRRLLAHGPSVYVPHAVFEHVGAASTSTWRKAEQHARLYHGTMVYAQSHLSAGRQLILGATIAAACGARTVMHLIVGDREAASTYFGLLLEARDLCALTPVRRRPLAKLPRERKREPELDERKPDRRVRCAAVERWANEPAKLAISVVIPNYRRPELLRECLPSVLRAAAASAHEVEVIVVDDGSGDGSCEIVRGEFPEVTLIALDRNRGYPTAVNAGVAACHGEWVFTLNNDTTVDQGIFDQLLTVARSAPDVGLVAAQQRFSSDAGIIYSAGMVMDYRGHASDRLMGQPVSVSERLPVEVFGACGAAALYRRSVLAELCGFDPLFAFGLEDADLAWRARARGWRCLYAPGAVVLHDLGGTVRHGSPTRLFQAGRNRLLLIAKNLEHRQLVRHLPEIVSFDVAYVVYAAIRLRTLEPVRGRVEGLRLWRTARVAGASQRAPVELSPPAPLWSALARRRAWRRASSAGTDPAPRWLRER